MFRKLLLTTAVFLAMPALAQEAPEDKAFTLDGEFGFNLTTGNTETTSINGGLTAKHKLKKWENDYIFEALYREDTTEDDNGVEETDVSAQRFYASGQANYKLTNPNNRIFGFLSYEDNRLGAFDYQGTAALGWSQKVWGTEKSAFEYSIGPGYTFQREQETDDDTPVNTNKFFVVRASAAYNWFISDTAKFTQTLSTEVGSENTSSRSESALSAQISGALSLKVAFRVDHNTDVAGDLENTDTETAITLVYSFF